MCRRESVSIRENRFLQACFLSSVSCAFERIQRLCGGKLSPLENLQGRRSIGPPGKSEGLRIFERTVDSQVWRKVV